MKRVVLIALTGVSMFGVSAFVSWKLHLNQTSSEASGQGELRSVGTGEAARQGSVSDTASALSAARPILTPATEEVTQLAASLRKRLAAVHEKEAEQVARQRNLDLVQQDLRTERTALEELHKQAAAELKKAEDIWSKLDRSSPPVPPQEPAPTEPAAEKLPRPREVREVEAEDYIRATELFHSLPPPNAAEMLEDLAKAGKLDAAAKLLAGIPARQAARILSEITVQGLADKLLEKQKKRKPLPQLMPVPKGIPKGTLP